MSEMQDRIDDYLSFGVPFVWLLDPRGKRAYVYTSAEIREVTDGVLRTAGPDIAVPLAELFD
jgi:Uma2 family endonuclease